MTRVGLGDIGHHRLRQDAQNRHGHAGQHRDEIAPAKALPAQRGQQKDQRIGKKSDHDEPFFAESGRQTVDGRIKRKADRRHHHRQQKGASRVGVHQSRDVKGQTGLKERHGKEIDDIRINEPAELPVFKGL